MIPMMNIIASGNVVPWAEQRQVEQDLMITLLEAEIVCAMKRERSDGGLGYPPKR